MLLITQHSMASIVIFTVGVGIGALFLNLVNRRSVQPWKRLPQSDLESPELLIRSLISLGEAVILLDGQNHIVGASPSAYTIGLIKKQRLIHKKLIEFVAKSRETKRDRVRIKTFSLKQGLGDSRSSVQVHAVNLGSDFVVLRIEDLNEALSLDRTRRDFVANISHELKTPIGAISLLAEAIQSALEEPEQLRHFSRSLEMEASRLTALVQDIIQLTKVQATEILSNLQDVDLGIIVREAISQVVFAAEKKNIKLSASGEISVRIFGDQELLTTLVKNLVENAVVYSEENTSVRVDLSEDGDVAEISVSDQGAGISLENQERIFERFYRIDPSRSRATGGTGLGLSIAKHITNKHLGDLTVSSELGEGSTFTVRLPMSLASDEPPGGTE